MRLDEVGDLWFKNAVVLCVDVETYLDSDGDGVGDFAGLTRQLDYIAGLGVTCLWLMPFFPSPNRDDGYDISDYYGVDPRLGTLGDFADFVRAADTHGIKVLLDLVVNHTSDEHPWFRRARAAAPGSPERDYYVWRDEPSDEPAGLAFPDKEDSNWEWDAQAGQYYLHRFYRFQPDLNIGSPAVRDEIARIVGFWLQLGVAGFRMDAVPFLLETSGLPSPPGEDPQRWLRELRAFAGRRRGGAVLLGEVNAPLHELTDYFGGPDGDGLQMQFAFLLNQSLWLALAREEAEPLEQVIRSLPPLPTVNAWAMFLRNHDELSLDKLTVAQREEVFAAFGPEADMQMYGHGLRRRAATMLGGDGARLRMAWSLMLSLPGTPVLFAGDEIGMGENLAIEDRYAVRVPMQWSDGPAGDFTTAPEAIVRPQPEGAFGVEAVNVAAQRRDPGSLLNWLERLIRRRRETPELGWGTSSLVETRSPALFAHRCDWETGTVIAVHNLSGNAVRERLRLDADVVALDDLISDRDLTVGEGGVVDLRLEAYGHRWLRVRREGERRLS
jgi:maltose alpha-D-glucosyltransferase/alpha-amylase